MPTRRRRLAELLSHWPQLSERERARLLAALGVNGLVSMTLEVVWTVALVRVARRSWGVRGRTTPAAERAAAARRVGRWMLLSAGQKVAARSAFTAYERHLSRRPDSPA